MHIAPRLLAALVIAAALGRSGAAQAGEPEAVATAPPAASDAPASVATTPAAPASVADQIDAYLETSPALVLPKDGPGGVTAGEDAPRKAHGMVDVAVGSNGYRSAFVQSELPVGKTGTLSIAVGETRFKGRGLGYWGGYGGPGAVDRQSLALGLSLGQTALDPHGRRCRQTAEEGFDPRFDAGGPSACALPRAPRPAQ